MTAKPPHNRARGAQRNNANATTHGHYALQRRLKNAGVTRNDGRSALERLKSDWKADIRSARGDDLAPQQEALLEIAANTWLMLSSADDFILERGAINRRKSTLKPIVEQRAKLARTLREILTTIGIERVPPPRPSLAAHLARYAERNAEGMGTPGLAVRTRSTARKFRRDSGTSIVVEGEGEADDVRDRS